LVQPGVDEKGECGKGKQEPDLGGMKKDARGGSNDAKTDRCPFDRRYWEGEWGELRRTLKGGRGASP